jgi:hypothetical protein
MKTKEIRERVKSMGFERGVMYALEAMNEAAIQDQRDLKELAHYFDKMVDAFNGVIAVADQMKSAVERIDKNRLSEEQLGANTHSLGTEQ